MKYVCKRGCFPESNDPEDSGFDMKIRYVTESYIHVDGEGEIVEVLQTDCPDENEYTIVGKVTCGCCGDDVT